MMNSHAYLQVTILSPAELKDTAQTVDKCPLECTDINQENFNYNSVNHNKVVNIKLLRKKGTVQTVDFKRNFKKTWRIPLQACSQVKN